MSGRRAQRFAVVGARLTGAGTETNGAGGGQQQSEGRRQRAGCAACNGRGQGQETQTGHTMDTMSRATMFARGTPGFYRTAEGAGAWVQLADGAAGLVRRSGGQRRKAESAESAPAVLKVVQRSGRKAA